jgi:hypothetical protein
MLHGCNIRLGNTTDFLTSEAAPRDALFRLYIIRLGLMIKKEKIPNYKRFWSRPLLCWHIRPNTSTTHVLGNGGAAFY